MLWCRAVGGAERYDGDDLGVLGTGGRTRFSSSQLSPSERPRPKTFVIRRHFDFQDPGMSCNRVHRFFHVRRARNEK